MTEEIKEILNFLKEPFNKEKTHKAIDKKDTTVLLNYITNLQKENEDLEEVINIKEHQLATMIEKKTDYTMTNILELKIMKLQNENEELRTDNKRLKHNEKVYKSRNEKAVEYIEKNILNKKIKDVNWEYDECDFSDMPVERIKPLLNILQGGDE